MQDELDRLCPIITFRTTGDRIQDRPLSEAGGKGLFTKEVEDALLAGEADIAVHSMKDMPTELPAGLTVNCYLPREDVRDAFLSRTATSLGDLPQGAVVASGAVLPGSMRWIADISTPLR